MRNNPILLEKSIRRLLVPFFVLIFLKTYQIGLTHYKTHNSWVMGDWLINYQGGFIRRGLTGEIIINVSKYLHINPGIIVFATFIVAYGLFFFFSWRILTKQDYVWPYFWLIFSPFIFMFQINDAQGGFRKEIIYFLLLSFLVSCALTCQNRTFKIFFLLVLALYPLVVLSHEMLIVFLPYILMVGVIKLQLSNNYLIWSTALVLLSLLAFLGVILKPVTLEQQKAIYEPLSVYPVDKIGSGDVNAGPISWLTVSLEDAFKRTFHTVLNEKYLFVYPFVFLLALLSFIPIFNRLHFIFQNKILFAGASLSILGTLLLSTIALDWGRFLYIHLVSWYTISHISPNNSCRYGRFSLPQKPIYKLLLGLLTVVYFLSWHIPRCCGIPITDNFWIHTW